MTADLAAMFGTDPSKAVFPSDPQTAMLLGLWFKQLGGMFLIDSTGKRHISRAFESVHPSAVPQMPAVKPHQRLQNCEQWEGAMRVIETNLALLHPDDKGFLFDLFAEAAAVVPSDAVNEPMRGAA